MTVSYNTTSLPISSKIKAEGTNPLIFQSNSKVHHDGVFLEVETRTVKSFLSRASTDQITILYLNKNDM